MATNSKHRKNHKQKVEARKKRLAQEKTRNEKMQREFIMNLIKQEQEKGLFNNTPNLSENGPVIDGPIIDGPVIDGPVINGPIIDGPSMDSMLQNVSEEPVYFKVNNDELTEISTTEDENKESEN